MGLTFLFPGRFWRWNRETNSPPAGPTRRFHEGAHDYRGDCARRATDRRRLRRLGHPRLRRALGLLGDLLDHDTGHLHTFGNRLNHRCAEQASEPLDHYDCKPFGRFDADADPNADPDANPNPNPNADPVGQCVPHRGSFHRRRGYGRGPGRLAVRAGRRGDPGRSWKHRLSQEAHQGPLTQPPARSLGSRGRRVFSRRASGAVKHLRQPEAHIMIFSDVYLRTGNVAPDQPPLGINGACQQAARAGQRFRHARVSNGPGPATPRRHYRDLGDTRRRRLGGRARVDRLHIPSGRFQPACARRPDTAVFHRP